MRTPPRHSIAQVLKIARAGGPSPRQRIRPDAHRFPLPARICSRPWPNHGHSHAHLGLVTRFSPSHIAQFSRDWTAMPGYRSADQNGGYACGYQAIFVPLAALSSLGYGPMDGQATVYLYIAALEVNVLNCRCGRGFRDE